MSQGSGLGVRDSLVSVMGAVREGSGLGVRHGSTRRTYALHAVPMPAIYGTALHGVYTAFTHTPCTPRLVALEGLRE